MSLRALKQVTRATVYKAGVRAGTLSRFEDRIRFEYDEDYTGPAVATTLPLGVHLEARSGGAVPPFFAGLLPEGRRLSAIRHATKTSVDDELSLLMAVGHDAIGDVQVLPEGSAPGRIETPPDVSGLPFAELFARVIQPDPIDRVGLPGVQDKVSAGMISVPVSWRDVPAILKLDPPEFPHLVENELFFYRAARASGLRTADAELVHDVVGAPGLLVRRFDRVPDPVGDGWRRLPQEDGCQVLRGTDGGGAGAARPARVRVLELQRRRARQELLDPAGAGR